MKIIPASDSSLLVVLGNEISPELHKRVIALFHALQALRDDRIRNLHPGYTSLLVVIVVAFAAGVASAGLAGLPGFFRRRSEAGAAARRIRELEAEVGDLKGKPGGPTPPAPGGTP
jgi:Allophanate hydrolase subunit 1